MGNRYGPRLDEFAWSLGVLRRLKRYLQAELTYAECALLLGCSRGSVAYGVSKLNEPKLSPEETRERRRRRAFERASHGYRSRNKIAEDSTYIESWKDYTARMQKKREEARTSSPS